MTHDDLYYYGYNTMKNKYGIMDAYTLGRIEDGMVVAKMQNVFSDVSGNFDTKHLQAIHNYLFQDLYDWAGKFRSYPLYRNLKYADPENIEGELKAWSDDVHDSNGILQFKNSDFDKSDFAYAVSKSWGHLNAIHPFCEGNGRSQYVFFDGVARKYDYHFDIGKQSLTDLRNARESASMGYSDGLYQILLRSMKPLCEISKEVRMHETHESVVQKNKPVFHKDLSMWEQVERAIKEQGLLDDPVDLEEDTPGF